MAALARGLRLEAFFTKVDIINLTYNESQKLLTMLVCTKLQHIKQSFI